MLGPHHVHAYVGLGANLGDSRQTIQNAMAALHALPATSVNACSSLYRSAPIDADGDDYINAVVALHTGLQPQQLLDLLQKVEQEFGRVRSYQNAPRTLDCDLLLYGHETLHSPTLTIPHPRIHQRAFVLMPLLELAPEIVIPELGAAKAFLAQVVDQSICKID